MHVLARLQGFGAIVVPKAPYRIERVDDAPDAVLRIGHGDRSETVDVRAVLGGTVTTDVADVDEGDPRPRWRIETSVFGCAWPVGFALSSDPDGLSPFLLLGPDDAMIWVAGPVDRAKTTPIEKLVTEDQTARAVASSGDRERIDIDYQVDGERWWQRRYVLAWGEDRTLVLTGQARAAFEAPTSAAVDAIEASIAPPPIA